MKKKFIVTVKETNVRYYDYEVEAETAEEAREDYEGWPCIDEEDYSGLEGDCEVVSVKEMCDD